MLDERGDLEQSCGVGDALNGEGSAPVSTFVTRADGWIH